jgi:XTP/dITP diphosphohydrolase
MPTLILATSNSGKVNEFIEMLRPKGWTVFSLKDIGFTTDIPEIGKNFRENAFIKAKAIAQACEFPVLSDDSGLEVEALGGAPGVHTARYAGASATNEENRAKLVTELLRAGANDFANRQAKFVCVLCWLIPGQDPIYFEGQCGGHIAFKEQGSGGFGYDSLFIPQGESQTFAELPGSIKHGMSHRGRAVQDWLKVL